MKFVYILICFTIVLHSVYLRPILKDSEVEGPAYLRPFLKKSETQEYVTPTLIPEYTTTHLTSPDIQLGEKVDDKEIKEAKSFLDWYEPILCTFTEEVIKEKPIIIVYCVLVALTWLCFTVTLLCFYLRDIFAEFKRINPATDELGGDRENYRAESSGEKVLLRMFSRRPNTAPPEFPIRTNRK